MPTDKDEGFIINEEAVKKWDGKILQKQLVKLFNGYNLHAVIKSGRVIGVVKDFNITPLKSAVQPLVMHYLPTRFQYLYLRFTQKMRHLYCLLFKNSSASFMQINL
jgi:hypothetical protein